MKSYLFEVIIEPDEDVFHAYVPVLEERGASTWGYTKEEALKHIQEVTKMVIESMIEDGEKIPQVRRTLMESQLVPSRFSGVVCEQTTERSEQDSSGDPFGDGEISKNSIVTITV